MKLQMTGLSHHTASVEVRERLAFAPEQLTDALRRFRDRFCGVEGVLLSTCNRVEVYTAGGDGVGGPSHHELVEFLAEFHGLSPYEFFDDLLERTGEDAVRHLFYVAASLDSMVVGEAQILSQVKQAYEAATLAGNAGPLMHAVFQAALRVARRVASETSINERRVSVPSVAVADFASQIFERFDDKQIVVIGAGEMSDESLRYLVGQGARQITVVNRSGLRGEQLAARHGGRAAAWAALDDLLVAADLIVGTTGASQPVVTLERFKRIEPQRFQRPLAILDLAVPRDFDPAIGGRLGVYLYGIDDLKQTCEKNRLAREKEWPLAERIVEEETARFISQLNYRETGPTIRRLKESCAELADEELERLFNKLQALDGPSREEIRRAFGRYTNKMLHPLLESLQDEAQSGSTHWLADALRRLFQLKD